MIIEKNKIRWISRNKLTNLLNSQALLKDILSIEIINSNELSDIKELSSYSQINKYIIVIISREYSFFLGLPFPFGNKKLSNPEDIVSLLTKDIVLGLLFFELGSWVSGIVKYKKVLFSKRGSRYVKGRHKAGGQSQRRFERNREKWIEGLNSKVYDDIKNYIIPEKSNIDYFICLGDTHSLNTFIGSTDLNKIFGDKMLLKRSSIKNYNSKTIIKASSTLWSSKIYLDDKNAIVEKIKL